MAISTVNRIKTITKKLNANDNSILTIYENSGLTIGNELIKDHQIISFNCFIKNLRAFSLIKSLAEITLPDFKLDDSETDKLYKTLDVEWQSARKQVTLYISDQTDTNPNGLGWFKVGSLSLLNPSGYPYRIYNLMDVFTDSLAIELGDNGKIGIQVENVGHGLLSLEDEVTIHGSYIEEIFVQSPDPSYVNIVTGSSSTDPIPTTPLEFPLEVPFRVSADYLQLAENEPVEQLPQLGTSSSTITQSLLQNRPVYKRNVINGKSAVYFDGQYKFLEVQPTSYPDNPEAITPLTENFAIFVVAISNNPNSTILTSVSGYSEEGNETSLDYKIISNAFDVKFYQTDMPEQLLNVSYTASSWNILLLRKVGQLITAYVNGVPYILGNRSDVLRFSYSYSVKLIIGLDYLQYDQPLNGYIADITILKDHPVQNLNTIGNYYKNFYNLNWTNI